MQDHLQIDRDQHQSTAPFCSSYLVRFRFALFRFRLVPCRFGFISVSFRLVPCHFIPHRFGFVSLRFVPFRFASLRSVSRRFVLFRVASFCFASRRFGFASFFFRFVSLGFVSVRFTPYPHHPAGIVTDRIFPGGVWIGVVSFPGLLVWAFGGAGVCGWGWCGCVVRRPHPRGGRGAQHREGGAVHSSGRHGLVPADREGSVLQSYLEA